MSSLYAKSQVIDLDGDSEGNSDDFIFNQLGGFNYDYLDREKEEEGEKEEE